MKAIEDIIRLVCGYLNRNKIDYVVVGGAVIPLYGAPRTTVDVDIILSIRTTDIPSLIAFLKKNGFFASEGDLKTALEEKSHCTIESRDALHRLDVKGVYSEFDEATLKRRRKIDFAGTLVYVASPEDLIISKLRFGSDRDINDAVSILVRQKNKLDWEYLETESKLMGVHRDLERLKKKAAGT
ncbi:MAG: DUF6036 family nucleotidyltransferase [Candidatus Micrarchaeia archaeon]